MAHIRVGPPRDYSQRLGKGPHKLVRDWAPNTPQTPPADDAYRAGHDATFQALTRAVFCPACDLRLSWCECVKAP